ncbi:MAG: response regulator [Cyclobacteriaceae bacterium]|nr:response regulator [Cyclobacteriaceae bacterium HetDA_MAG_MS6]
MDKVYTSIAIDDDPMFLTYLESLIHEIPVLELSAKYTNPVDGLMAVVKAKPDIIFLDYEMPYLDGTETLETLDKKPKIIVISGHLNNPNVAALEVDKFISKSSLLEPEQLEQSVRQVMGE